MKKIIVITSVLFLCVMFAAVFYFSNLSVKTHTNDKILAQIPGEATLIFQFRNDKSFSEIFKGYELFGAMLGRQRVAEIIQTKELLLKHPQLIEGTDGQDMFLSLFPGEADSTELLWTMSLNDNISSDDIYALLLQPSGDLETQEITVSKQKVLSVTVKSLNKAFYVCSESNTIAGSFSKKLIEKFLDKTVARLPKSFISDVNTADKKNSDSPFNLFINHSSAFTFAAKFLRAKPDGNFSLLNHLGGSSVLNMNFKSDAFMFNGSATTDTSMANYINVFLHQTPVPVTIKNIFPASTSSYLAFGLSDYKKFQSRLMQLHEKRKELSRLTAQINRLKEKYSINIDAQFSQIRISEFAVLQLSSFEKLALINVNDGSKLKFLLESLSSVSSGEIRRLNDSNMLYYYFGDPLKPYMRPFYAVVDNHLVVSNEASTVQKFLNDYSSDYLLYKTTGFSEFSQWVASQSNIQFFIHNKNSSGILKNNLRSGYARAFTNENSGYKDFYGFSYQWSADRDRFFVNLYANYVSPGANKLEILWEYPLNARLSIPPQVVSAPDNKKAVVVQDVVNNLYVLSETGKKLWSTQLADKILGDIHQLSDNSLVFNTQNQLYRLDINGTSIKGFPVKLSKQASYGLTVTDTDPAKLKIFIPCKDQISAFDPAGKTLPGWGRPMGSKILFDLKTTRVNDTNYLIAGTTNGQFYFFNFNGNQIGRVQDPAERVFTNPLTLETMTGIDDSKIVTTDTSGAVRSIFFNGKISSKNIGVWSGGHFFDRRNISGDVSPELIYLDKNQLYVYNSDSTLLYNYDFGNSAVSRPQFFRVSQSLYQLGISSPQDDLLYLFADDGSIAKGFPVKGVSGFYAGNFLNNGFKYLICSDRNNFLYVYKLE